MIQLLITLRSSVKKFYQCVHL